MGLLDDAIREHLELKRRRGADPGEVAREQHEALDPVEREPRDPIATVEDDVVVGHAPEPDAGQAYDVPDAGAIAAGAPEDMADEQAHAPQAHDASGATPGETAELDMRTVLGGDPTPGVAGGVRPAPVAGAPLRDDVPAATEDSLEWEMPSDEAEAEAEQDEDVLEETPDFLRDTPEQDRLWFEQRPPRDFDFDK